MRRALLLFGAIVVAIAALNAWGAGDDGGIYLTQATMLAAATFASVLALVVGNGLGRERNRLASSSLLRPISRERYAWTVFGVDIAALVIAYIGASFVFVGLYEAAHGFAPIDLRGASLLTCLILPLGAVLASYGIMTACSVAARGSRLVAVILGPAAYILWLGGNAQIRDVARGFQLLDLFNPMMYLMAAVQRVETIAHPDAWTPRDDGFYSALPLTADAFILYAIAFVALGLATLSWKRAEV